MRGTLKFLTAMAVALCAVLVFRALAFTVFAVTDNTQEPHFLVGDRIMVNRWAYGLRTGEAGSLFPYGRLGRCAVGRQDIIAIDDSLGRVSVCRCLAVPGDTLKGYIVPGLLNCARKDFYLVETLTKDRARGLVAEERIIGRVVMVVYNHDDSLPLWTGYRKERFFLPR